MTAGTGVTLPDWLGRRLSTDGDRLALQTEGGAWTYRQLHERATQMAGALHNKRVKRGDRVAVIAYSGEWFALAVHTLMQIGAVLVPVNWRLTVAEIAWQLDDAGVRLVLADEAGLESARQASRQQRSSSEVVSLTALAQEQASPVRRTVIRTQDVHAIIYTSGTTGRPKGAMITYGNHWWSAMGSALQLGLTEQDRWLVPMPLFHVGGLAVLMRSLIYGTTAVVHDRFDVAAVHRAIDEEGVTLLSVVSTMLQRMVEARGDAPYPSTLRCILLGGSGAPRALLERALALSAPVAQSYGLTEANTQVCTLRPQDALRKLGSSGKPLLPTEIAIEVDGKRAQPGQEGEIIVRGPTVMAGYWQREEATREAIVDGWLHTGDIGYLDAEGYLFVLDRRKDLIVSGGENIYPAEVESVLLRHPAVADAAVVGVADEQWGQTPVACVVLCNPVTDDVLIQFCRQHLAGYKVPRRIMRLAELPRNASGKLLRRQLREWLDT
ncbi:o-succinylbenzoate--CoA ligase [Alicyclobacillus shizuokensis]|uniref:o-succinylbenzoate--CoA ligase n=1 Tax=Alicyclobacillus shizuokensis TaxID=392014 RepID=UPI00082B8D92|nr:o-succinylbenzoate--CoA ligase [Alicyclobacillus shizuokensis]MCL6627285.1 o-succinylbenzoate--CoA ligase [Alicyclobacillus shizuokensis]